MHGGRVRELGPHVSLPGGTHIRGTGQLGCQSLSPHGQWLVLPGTKGSAPSNIASSNMCVYGVGVSTG